MEEPDVLGLYRIDDEEHVLQIVDAIEECLVLCSLWPFLSFGLESCELFSRTAL